MVTYTEPQPEEGSQLTSAASASSTESAVATDAICTTPNCTKPARMACPTCLKLNIPPSRFCGQTCFTSFWEEHKKLHAEVRRTRTIAKIDPSLMPTEFSGFQFTGTLRPYQKTPRREVPGHIARPDYASHPLGISLSERADRRTNTSIQVYTPSEIAAIREVCRIGREVLDIAGAQVRVGVTCDEIDRVVHEAILARDAYPSPLNYMRFPKSLCTSVNEVICHGIPDLRPLQDGDIVNLDISVFKDGFHADLNETFFVGEVDADGRRVVQCAHECLAAAIAIVRPGTLYRELGDAISAVAKRFKCSVVTSFIGHGIGRLFHTVPDIPHYAKNKAKGTMQVGHVFTIEPMVNLGVSRDVWWPDEWTVVTADGQRSAQFEHTMVVTETGVEVLTARAEEVRERMGDWDATKFQR